MPYLMLNLPVFSVVFVFWMYGTLQRLLQEQQTHTQRNRVLRERVAFMLWTAANQAAVVEDELVG
jgi:hypothetical protein